MSHNHDNQWSGKFVHAVNVPVHTQVVSPVNEPVLSKIDIPPKVSVGAAVHTLQTLAADIANLAAAGPGKVTQVQLDSLHAHVQSILGKL